MSQHVMRVIIKVYRNETQNKFLNLYFNSIITYTFIVRVHIDNDIFL